MRDGARTLDDGSQTQRNCAGAASTAGDVADGSSWADGNEQLCTEENGFRQGIQGTAFVSSCPDSLATAYLDGYQSGYTIYLQQLEVDAMERAIEAKSAELTRVNATLNAAPRGLAQRDELQSLVSQQHVIGNQLDELESEVSARKAQLLRQRHAIAESD